MVWLLVLAGGSVTAVCVWSALDRRRLRRSGADDPWARMTGTLPGLLDEVFHPEAYEAPLIQEGQRELPAPAPVPGDGPLEEGATRIVLSVPAEPAPDVESARD